MDNEPGDDRGWSPGHRNQETILAWALGIVMVSFLGLAILLFCA